MTEPGIVVEPRIAPGGRRNVGLLTWAFGRIAARAIGTTRPPNLFMTLGRHRGLFRAWLWFAGRLMPRGKLPRRDTELVILRVAHLRGCEYEWDHHVELGRRAGVGQADLRRVAEGPGADGWTPREQAILGAVDELHASGDLADGPWVELAEHLDQLELIELVLLAGHYEMLATAIKSLRIQPDART
jgi:AhpD family alkylhydroperoxidase